MNGRDSGYFVRLQRSDPAAPDPARHVVATGARGAPGPPGAVGTDFRSLEPAPPRRRRRKQFSVRPLPFLLLALLGWVGWASTTDGGVSARVEDIVDMGRDVVDDATTDPNLKRAALYYNDRYEVDGMYTRPAAALDADPEADFGIGVEVIWCSRDAIVLQSYTGHGAISRLLARGADLGDVIGEIGCPADLDDPQPWRYRTG